MFIAKIESLFVIKSTILLAKQNIKKLEKLYGELNLVDPKNLNKVDMVYYELWFIFLDEIIHIQKLLINFFTQPTKKLCKQIISKIKLILKPIPIEILNFKPKEVNLFVHEKIYELI